MISLAAAVLPALLAPNVRKGQQLHYHTTWTRQTHAPALAGSPILTGVDYTVTVLDVTGTSVSWNRKYTGGSDALLKFSSDASGQVVDRSGRKAAELPVFIYNSALLGNPPQQLRRGATWTNTIHRAASQELWTSTVEEADPLTRTVRLRLTFRGHSEVGGGGATYSEEQSEAGEAVFVQGVMTKLSMQGRETTVYPERRITESVAIETRLEGSGSP